MLHVFNGPFFELQLQQAFSPAPLEPLIAGDEQGAGEEEAAATVDFFGVIFVGSPSPRGGAPSTGRHGLAMNGGHDVFAVLRWAVKNSKPETGASGRGLY